MNLRNKLEALIIAVNTTTGQSDTDLTSAIQHLKDGFGIGETLGGGYNIIVTENEDGSQNLAITTVAAEANTIEEIETAAEMDSLLTEVNVGKLYKYIGVTDDNYINGDIYEVEVV